MYSRIKTIYRLDVNPLDLVEREFLVGAIIQLRGAGRLVTGDARGDFLDAAVSQVLGDAGPPETVIRYLTGQSRHRAPAA